MRTLQPFLHEQVVLVAAPTQALCAPDGSMGADPVQGLFHSDVRALRTHRLTVTGSDLEPLSTTRLGAAGARFTALARDLDPTGADPRTVLTATRTLTAAGTTGRLTEELVLEAAWPQPVTTTLTLTLTADLSGMDLVKSGRSEGDLPWQLTTGADGSATATTARGAATVRVQAAGAQLATSSDAPTELTLTWQVRADATHPFHALWSLEATDDDAVVVPALTLPAPARTLVTDPRARAWSQVALDDVAHLLLARTDAPHHAFAAAGAPWFLTLFGRDSLWTARLLLEDGDPWSLALAEGTLRTLADLQGRTADPDTAEQPGKVMHELRRGVTDVDGAVVLPPLYYGTIDATPLWVLTLADAWEAGLSEVTVTELLPSLRAALAWMRDDGDADADGLLEYVDATGHGLANQGWKDSGDSVQFDDGRLARGPIALVEVQAYAYAAALAGARLLEALGGPAGAQEAAGWRTWAARLRERFTEAFWVGDTATGYLAIALDADKSRVDSLTSNIGHVLGTGILDQAHAARTAALLVGEELSSGYGVRTLATTAAGYWPLSYHGGSVWTHDTAIAIDGLLRAGFDAEARVLAEDLLSAAPTFGNRMPELFSGAPASAGPPVPYPASCRPQAWAAAASAVVARAVADHSPTA